jgi:hypothetical protein
VTQQVAASTYRYRQPSPNLRKQSQEPVGPGRGGLRQSALRTAAAYATFRNRLGKRCHEFVTTDTGMARSVVARKSGMKSTRAFPTCNFAHHPFIVGTTSRRKATRPIPAECDASPCIPGL